MRYEQTAKKLAATVGLTEPEMLEPGYAGPGAFEDDDALLEKLREALRNAPRGFRLWWGLPGTSKSTPRTGVRVVASYGDPQDQRGNRLLRTGGSARASVLWETGQLAAYEAFEGAVQPTPEDTADVVEMPAAA